MKLTGLLLFVLILLGCNRVSPEEKAKQKADSIRLHYALLPEAEKRQICKDKVRDPEEFDYTKHLWFEDFFKLYYPADSAVLRNYGSYITQELYGIQEEWINPNYVVKKDKWFRLFMYPTFYNSFVLKVEKIKWGEYLFTYKLSCMDGYNSVGTLLQYSYIPKDSSMCFDLFSLLDNFSFSHPNFNKDRCGGFDGNHWYFEYFDGKTYRKANYADPQQKSPCGSPEAYRLAIHCLNIIKKSPAYKTLKSDFSDGGKESPYGYLQMYPETLPN
jgi:hypothetical protein